MTMLDRRLFLFAGCAVAACGGPTSAASTSEAAFAASPWRKLGDGDWKKRLSPAAYAVLRHEDTERPGSSPLEDETRKGTFVCSACALPLFKSQWKYHSGSGWPSFWRAMKANIGTKQDFVLLVPRTEYHCARCLGHQGHIFEDGPRPTGLRYCNNGLALRFIPA